MKDLLVTWIMVTLVRSLLKAKMKDTTGKKKTQYMKNDQYNVYWYQEDLQFPVEPLWNVPGVRKKTPIAVDRVGEKWVARFPDMPAAAGSSVEVHALVFAWYAQHADDTDYGAIKGK